VGGGGWPKAEKEAGWVHVETPDTHVHNDAPNEAHPGGVSPQGGGVRGADGLGRGDFKYTAAGVAGVVGGGGGVAEVGAPGARGLGEAGAGGAGRAAGAAGAVGAGGGEGDKAAKTLTKEQISTLRDKALAEVCVCVCVRVLVCVCVRTLTCLVSIECRAMHPCIPDLKILDPPPLSPPPLSTTPPILLTNL
jgi:hypothetical protein